MTATTRWRALAEVRGETVVVLVRDPHADAGALAARALADAAALLGAEAMVAGPFYLGQLPHPAWYGRVTAVRLDRDRLRRMSDAATAVLAEAGCEIELPELVMPLARLA